MHKTCPDCKKTEPEVKFSGYKICNKCKYLEKTKAKEYPAALALIKELKEENKELKKENKKFQEIQEENKDLIQKLENKDLKYNKYKNKYKEKLEELEKLKNEFIEIKFLNNKLQTTFDVFSKLNIQNGEQ